MRLLTLFKRYQCDATEEMLGDRKILSYVITTPRTSNKRLAWFCRDEYIVHLSARDSFSASLAERALDRIAEVDCSTVPSSVISVFPTDFPPPFGFESLVVAPPAVKWFEHWPEELQLVSYLVAPAYKSEFSDGMSVGDFRHQLGRKDGWRVKIENWLRPEKKSPVWD
jgi:hypothetical protein